MAHGKVCRAHQDVRWQHVISVFSLRGVLKNQILEHPLVYSFKQPCFKQPCLKTLHLLTYAAINRIEKIWERK